MHFDHVKSCLHLYPKLFTLFPQFLQVSTFLLLAQCLYLKKDWVVRVLEAL